MSLMKRFLSLAILAVSSSLVVSQVNAETASTNFDVKLNVLKSCSIAKPNDINFGNLLLSDLKTQSANTTLTVACTAGTGYNIAMWGQNNLKNVNDQNSILGYNIKFDSNNTANVASSGTGNNQDYTVVATLTGQNTNVKEGQYSDTVTAQISY